MLLRLARRNTELYPNDPIKRDKVYNKYKVGRMCSLSTFIGKGLPRYLFIYFFQWTCLLFSLFLFEQQFEIPEEEAEWVGLNMEEAVEKQRQLEHKVKHARMCKILAENKQTLCLSDVKVFVLLTAGARASI